VNKAYGMSVAARYGAMAKGLEGGFAAVSSLFDSYPWGGQNAPPVNLPGPGIGSIPAAVVGLGTTAASSVLDAEGLGGLGTLLGDLTSGTFWKRIGVFSLGAALTLVGLAVFISTTKPGQKATSDAAVAALALA
jgi:hypothetical protein